MASVRWLVSGGAVWWSMEVTEMNEDDPVREAAARNVSATEAVLRAALKAADPAVREAAAGNPSAPEAVLRAALKAKASGGAGGS